MAAIEVKTPDQLRQMRRAGLVVADGLAAMQAAAGVGVTTAELDQVGRDVIHAAGARSNFLNYGAEYGTPFPGVACISVNDELVHGIPGPRPLTQGDVVTIDFGAVVEGWHGDAAVTFVVGEPREEDLALIDVTRGALWAGIGAVRDGARVGDVSRAIDDFVSAAPRRYGTLRDYTGHGIGSQMHMSPDVPNFYRPRPTARLRVGMALAIEPMLTLGRHHTTELDDGWTVVSRDGSRGAHCEHTVAITEAGLWVLTAPDGGEAELVGRGLPFGPLAD